MLTHLHYWTALLCVSVTVLTSTTCFIGHGGKLGLKLNHHTGTVGLLVLGLAWQCSAAALSACLGCLEDVGQLLDLHWFVILRLFSSWPALSTSPAWCNCWWNPYRCSWQCWWTLTPSWLPWTPTPVPLNRSRHLLRRFSWFGVKVSSPPKLPS